jgi:hypothetical protein
MAGIFAPFNPRFWFPLPGHDSFLPVKPRKAAALTLLSASRRPIIVGSLSLGDCVQAVHFGWVVVLAVILVIAQAVRTSPFLSRMKGDRRYPAVHGLFH